MEESIEHLEEIVGGTVALMLIAAGLLAVVKKIKLPFTVMLVVTGMLLTTISEMYPHLIPGSEFEISPGLVLFVFLPALIFESAFNLDARHLWHNIWPVLTLAVPGLLLSTFAIGGIVWGLTGIPFSACVLLGAILSATDPVSVVALFKKLGAPERLTILVEGESLFNDATAIVLATIVIGVVEAGDITGSTLFNGVIEFFVVFLGGLVVGGVLGWFFGWLLGKVQGDTHIEITLTTVVAYMSFIVAEAGFHVSGVIAVIAAGLVLGGWGRMKISVQVRNYLDNFWEYMAFVANALIFLLVGLRVDFLELWHAIGLVGIVVLAMLVSRAGVVYGLVPIVGRLPGVEPVDLRYQSVMYWGGLRGAIALAIVLMFVERIEQGELFVTLVIGAVLFTLIVQGVTIEPLVKKLGLDQPPLADKMTRVEGESTAKQHALHRLPDLLKGGLFSGSIAGELQELCNQDLEHTRQEIEQLRKSELDVETERQLLYLRAFAEEKSVYIRLFNEGQITERTFRDMMAELIMQTDAIRHTEEHADDTHEVKVSLRRRVEDRILDIFDRIPGLSGLAERAKLAHIATDYERSWAQCQSTRSVLDVLENMAHFETVPESIQTEIREQYSKWHETARTQLDQTAGTFPEFVSALQARIGKRIVLLAQAETIEEQEEYGTLPRSIAEGLKEEIHESLLELSNAGEVSQLKVEPTELLKKVPFFQEVPPHEFADIANRMRSRTFTEGSAVIKQDAEGDSMFLIARGVVRVSRVDNGNSRDLATLMAGDFFGEMALLHRDPRTATVRAITPSSLYELRRDDLDQVIEKYPDMRKALEEADQQRKAQLVEQS
jgi:monovalent cation:H+ antiporter, CPA1 family